jgi:hypothetical protein
MMRWYYPWIAVVTLICMFADFTPSHAFVLLMVALMGANNDSHA